MEKMHGMLDKLISLLKSKNSLMEGFTELANCGIAGERKGGKRTVLNCAVCWTGPRYPVLLKKRQS